MQASQEKHVQSDSY